MASQAEVLVVDLDPEWVSRLPVVASVLPRVVVVRIEPDDIDELAARGRLTIVRDPDGTAEIRGDLSVLDELDEGARLFLEAWRLPLSPKVDRPGEGRSWDSPGFEPPDLPTH